MIQACAGMLTYFWVMNDYGFPIKTLIFLNQELGYIPRPTDVYNPALPNFGNSNWGYDKYRD